MERIKNLKEIVLRGDMIMGLVKEVKPKSTIILPDEVKANQDLIDYITVVAKGSNVTDVEIGDIILKYDGAPKGVKIGDKDYAVINRNFCMIIVKPRNFKLS